MLVNALCEKDDNSDGRKIIHYQRAILNLILLGI